MEIERPDAGPAGTPGNLSYPARLRSRLAFALVLSLGLHVLVMLLQFGDADFGLPGLGLPWGERRLKADDLSARLADVARPQAPAPAPTRGPLAVVPYVPPEAVAPEVPKPEPKPGPKPRPKAKPPRAEPPPAPEEASRKSEVERRKVEEAAQPEILTQSEPQQETFEAPAEDEARQRAEGERRKEAEAQRLALEEAEARRKAEVERQKVDEAAQREAEELARRRAMALEETRRKEEAAQRLALEAEKRKEEEARRLALEAEKRKEEEAQRLALEEARRKAEAERRKQEEEARRKAEIERQKEKEAAAQRERERLAAEKALPRAAPGAAPAPGAPSGSEIAAKALEQLRTPGALRADPPPARPAGPGGVRRRAVLRGERDVDLRFYVESWRAKIERYGTLNYRPGAARGARDYPVVTVSIRSDGSVEDVLINRSSGLRELDEAARRIAQLYAPYSAFPPALARQFDVIEIRRVWQFDETLRIVEEM